MRAWVAALLGSGARLEKNDLLAALDCQQDPRTLQQLARLRRIARPAGPTRHDDDALLTSVLAGFPDRVARRRSGQQVLLSGGGSAELIGEPPEYEFMIAVDAEDRKDKPLPLLRTTARIEPEWLIDLFPQQVREQSGVEWNRAGERAEVVSSLLYDELLIQQSRRQPQSGSPEMEAAAELLARRALEAGIERFVDQEAWNEWLARVAFAGYPPPDVPQALRDLCAGLESFAELKSAAANLLPMLERNMPALEQIAPVRIRLQNGRQTKVHYDKGQPPWIASRVQDFFGMRQTPCIGPHQTPLVVHLLAPNQRAVQTTSDLTGFWERLYPQVRRELMRRYPRHAWPERP